MFKKVKNRKPGESGIALIMVLGVLAVLLILAVTFAFNMRVEQRAARNFLDYITADFHAKAGIDHAVAAMRNPSDWLEEELADGREVEYNETDFTYTITPLSGRLDLNFTGNLSGSGAAEHNSEQGWSTFEISISDVFESLGVPWANAENMAREIIERRYGNSPTAGGADDTYDESLASGSSGIDHDASGGLPNFDPFWFSEWRPRIEPGSYPVDEHDPFDAETLQTDLQSLHADFVTFWDLIEDYITAGTRSSGELGQYINLNAVERAGALFNRMGLSAGTFAQKAVNIIDHRDANHHISSLSLAQTYYGVESILINEVLANSYYEPEIAPYENEGPGESSPPLEVGSFAYNTNFVMRVHIEIEGSPENHWIRIWGDDPSDYEEFDYSTTFDSGVIESSADGMFYLSTYIEPNAVDPDEEVKITINQIELVCAEFIEIVNIGEEAISLDGFMIVIVPAEGSPVSGSIPIGEISPISPGEYVIFTNNESLFTALNSVPLDTQVFEIPEWDEKGYYPPPTPFSDGQFPNDGNFDILIYDARGNLIDLAVAPLAADNSLNVDVANTSRPGDSGKIGVSMEKDDPAVRNNWHKNEYDRASPGEHNSRTDLVARDILDNLGSGTYPPLIPNSPFANVVGVQNVISGNSWQGISDGTLFSIAGRGSAYYIRLDAERADSPLPAGWAISSPSPYGTDMVMADSAGADGVWEWEDVRLNPDIEYDLYIYGIYGGEPGQPDLELAIIKNGADVMELQVEYRESDGARVARINEDHIGDNGDLRIRLESLKPDVYFDYLMLVPDGVPGKININIAEREVLMGLPGIDTADLADNIIANRPYGNTGELLRAFPQADSAELFAPVANLVAVALLGSGGPSDIYRIISTGRNVGPMGDPDLPTAIRKIDMVVRLMGDGTANVLSWKYVYD